MNSYQIHYSIQFLLLIIPSKDPEQPSVDRLFRHFVGLLHFQSPETPQVQSLDRKNHIKVIEAKPKEQRLVPKVPNLSPIDQKNKQNLIQTKTKK